MDIIFKKITASSDIPLEIKDLYLSSFPEEERREWSDIQNKIDSGNPVFSFYVLQHKGTIIFLNKHVFALIISRL